jgi:hypothetical protein
VRECYQRKEIADTAFVFRCAAHFVR